LIAEVKDMTRADSNPLLRPLRFAFIIKYIMKDSFFIVSFHCLIDGFPGLF
jgi:hypothetical protein